MLVHGWGGSAGQLYPFVEPLVRAGFAVVAFDAPGHGASTGSWLAIPRFAAALARVAEQVGPLHAIIAHSLGGPAAAVAIERGLHTGALRADRAAGRCARCGSRRFAARSGCRRVASRRAPAIERRAGMGLDRAERARGRAEPAYAAARDPRSRRPRGAWTDGAAVAAAVPQRAAGRRPRGSVTAASCATRRWCEQALSFVGEPPGLELAPSSPCRRAALRDVRLTRILGLRRRAGGLLLAFAVAPPFAPPSSARAPSAAGRLRRSTSIRSIDLGVGRCGSVRRLASRRGRARCFSAISLCSAARSRIVELALVELRPPCASRSPARIPARRSSSRLASPSRRGPPAARSSSAKRSVSARRTPSLGEDRDQVLLARASRRWRCRPRRSRSITAASSR